MPEITKKKVVYLFGAGATHAELTTLDPDLEEVTHGLLIGNVSERVIQRARKDPRYVKGLELVTNTGGSLNIELLISLIENSKINNWAQKADKLKKLVEDDIKSILTDSKKARFSLHKALLELHSHDSSKVREDLIGLISLNYDDVLDQAYRAVFGQDASYCFSLDAASIPLLKLHGSFNWKNQFILSKKRTVEIIPLGASKTYLHVPYGFIWSRALELLVKCDVLRVIGCSLSPNDVHLIDLLFKAHLEREQAFDIEILDFESTGERIQQNYGFFPRTKRWSELTDPVIPDPAPDNPFRVWLRYKSFTTIKEAELKKTRFIRKVFT